MSKSTEEILDEVRFTEKLAQFASNPPGVAYLWSPADTVLVEAHVQPGLLDRLKILFGRGVTTYTFLRCRQAPFDIWVDSFHRIGRKDWRSVAGVRWNFLRDGAAWTSYLGLILISKLNLESAEEET